MDREDRLKTAIILVVLAVDAAGFAALGLRFDWPSALKVIPAWPILMAIGWFYMNRRADPPVAHLMRETAHLAAFTAVGAMLSYLAAALNRPLIDVAGRGRPMIGFDWTAYVAFVNERHWLGSLSSVLYISTLPQVAVAVILLPVLGLSDRSRELVLAVMLAALIAILRPGSFRPPARLRISTPTRTSICRTRRSSISPTRTSSSRCGRTRSRAFARRTEGAHRVPVLSRRAVGADRARVSRPRLIFRRSRC